MSHEPTTMALIEAFRNGDESAATELYRRFDRLLVPYARTKLGRAGRSPSRASSVFLSAIAAFFHWARRPDTQLNDSAHAENTLKRIIGHKVSDRTPLRGPMVEPGLAVDDRERERESWRELRQTVEDIIANWPPPDCDIVRLRADESMSEREIARRLGCSRRSVRSVLERFAESFARSLEGFRT